eukprot:22631-Eustigmatos_ZCMA.PRE.1
MAWRHIRVWTASLLSAEGLHAQRPRLRDMTVHVKLCYTRSCTCITALALAGVVSRVAPPSPGARG